MSQEIPEDLGLVVATKEEAFWKQVLEENKTALEKLEKQIKLYKAVIGLANDKIKLEADSNNSNSDS